MNPTGDMDALLFVYVKSPQMQEENARLESGKSSVDPDCHITLLCG